MKTLKEVMVDGDDFYISLTKLTGKKIADIHGYTSQDYGFVTSKIIFEDGTSLFFEGEHDAAYVYNDKDMNLDDETLDSLNREANPEEYEIEDEND